MFQAWQPVPLDTPWHAVAPACFLAHTDTDAVLVDVRRDKGDRNKIKLRLQRLNGERFELKVTRKTAVAKTMRQQFKDHDFVADPLRIIAIPTLVWSEDKLFSVRNLIALLATTAVATVFFSMGPGQWYSAVCIGGAAAMGVRRIWKSGNHVSIMAPDRLGITAETVLPYALAREQGKLWVPPQVGADRRQLAFQRVGTIRDHYLALREDIAYRIENSALFDPKVPATAEFEASLVAFDDVTEATSTDDLDTLASEVELTFNVAQSNAERLGFTHLPVEARADGHRASKAARLAAAAGTEGERQASLTQVKRILDSLGLYYLPTLDERLAIEAAPPKNR